MKEAGILFADDTDVKRRRLEKRRRGFSRLKTALFVAAAGAVTALQINNPSKRVLEAVAGLVLLFLLWNISSLSSLFFLLIAYPFPFAVIFGSSNIVFIFIVFIIHLVRLSSAAGRFQFDRRFAFPIGFLLLTYALSFYNQDTTSSGVLRFSIAHTASTIACVVLFFLISALVDDEEKLRRTVTIFLVSASFVIAFTIIELLFPARVLIPGWLYTQHRVSLIMKDLRMGGPFRDYELTAEFFALNAPIILLFFARSRRLLSRSLLALLLLADIVMLFSTITRGAFFSLTLGMLYLSYLFRKDLNFVRFVAFVAVAVILIVVINSVLTQYTISGSLFKRVASMTFTKGWIPENRYLTWTGALERAMKHPIIGNGPGWDFTDKLHAAYWPHNVYLYYLNITGILGLAAFLWLMYRLMRASLGSFGASLIRSPFPDALLKVLHVSLVMFLFDQIKIEYLRNDIYMYFIWIFFGLIAASSNIAAKNKMAPDRIQSPT